MNKILKAIPILLLLAGCSTEKRQIEKQHIANYKRPHILVEDFNRMFPLKPDSVGKVIPADNSASQRRIDSLTAALISATTPYTIDSTFCDTATLYRAYLKEVASSKRKDAIIAEWRKAYNEKKPDTIPTYKNNCPQVPLLTNQLRVAQDSTLTVKAQLKQSKKSNKTKTWWIVGLSVAAVASHLLRSYVGKLFGWVKGVVK